jgi:mycothiol synthase
MTRTSGAAYAHDVFRERPIRYPEDVRPVREFLARLWPLAPLGSVWEVRRWDGCLFHNEIPGLAPDRAARSRLWVAEDDRVAAAALSEGGRQIHPHVAPEAAELLEDVVAWAEQAAGDDHVLLTVWEGDDATRCLALARGYHQTDGFEMTRLLRLDAPTPTPPPLPEGYVLRTTADEPGDRQGIADLLNAAFGRTFHTAGEVGAFTRLAPSFRRETDLVAEAPDGTLAAYAAVCWDDANRHAIFEPVCTHPEHRQRGLAKALMLEGMRRAAALGATTIEVGTGDADPANALYASLPFTDVATGRLWERALA